ncbi:MAG: hypothetical protein ACK4GN_01925 [Runella sp.]
MKKKIQLYQTIFVGLLIGLSSLTFGQTTGRYNLRLVPDTIDCASNKVVACVEIQSTSADSAFTMGNGNIWIGHRQGQLINPIIKSRHNFTNGDYNSISYVPSTGADTSILSLNITYRGEFGDGQQVNTTWKRIACLEFTIPAGNTAKSYDLFIFKNQPETVITRAFAAPTQQDPGRTLTATVTQGTFTNIVNQKPILPAVTITGTQTINEGQSATLNLATQTGSLPINVTLSNGQNVTLTSIPSSGQVSVSPNQTTTYTITNVSNACGTGTGNGQAIVTVLKSSNDDCSNTRCIPVRLVVIR